MALGLTQQLPEDDRYTLSKEYLEAQLSVLMAGRVAENMFLNKTTTGAANDLERATDIAHKMVCQYGMSNLGPLAFGKNEDMVFLGRELTTQKNFSEKTAERIDDEVKNIITRNCSRAKELLEKHKNVVIKTAEALLEKEVLTSDEIKALVAGKDIMKNLNNKKPPKDTKPKTAKIPKPAPKSKKETKPLTPPKPATTTK
jgi:cell division protease FtsH